jgi:hypothetical protein
MKASVGVETLTGNKLRELMSFKSLADSTN